MMNQNHVVPEACCQRAAQTAESAYTSQEQCLSGNMMFRNNKVTFHIHHVKTSRSLSLSRSRSRHLSLSLARSLSLSLTFTSFF